MPKNLPLKVHLSHETVVVHHRPDLAVDIAWIVTAWTRIEELIGHLLVTLLGNHARTGMVLYQALSGSASQNAVLRAAAQDRLSKSLCIELEAVLKEFKRIGRKRNDVAHGQWMLSDEHQNCLVWTDTRANLLAHSDFWAGYREKPSADEQIKFAMGWNPSPGIRLLYSKEDFEAIKDEIRNLSMHMMAFNLQCTDELGAKPKL